MGSGMLLPAAEWVVRRRERELDDVVAHHSTRVVIDWFAAAVTGSVLRPSMLVRAALDGETVGSAAVLPTGLRASARTAALCNGTSAHAAELDDIFREGLYHPGAPTVAAALAVAQARGSSGPELLAAVTSGVELSTRIAAAMQPRHYRFWHTTGTVGAIGAAVAASSLLGSDAEAIAHAAATATTMGAGLQQAMRGDSMSKPLHSGRAAEAGVLAALLAAQGYHGALNVLDGAAGLGAATAGGPDWSGTFDDLETVSHVGALTIKVHACCGHTFAAIDAALELREEYGLDAGAVGKVEVETYGTALTVAGNADPVTAIEAKFSITYCVASALGHGEVGMSAFSDERLASEPLRALTGRVSVSVDPELDAVFPGRRGARVRLHLADGRVVERIARTRKGDPDAPVSDEELARKFDVHVAPVLGQAGCEELAARLWDLARYGDVSDLLAPVKATAGTTA